MNVRHIQSASEKELLKSIYREVHEKSDFRNSIPARLLWCKFMFYGGIAVSTYTLLYYIESPALFIVLFVAYGLTCLLLAFNFAHDFSHGALFKRQFWNEAGFIFVYALNGVHAEAWRERHVNSHHHAPNVDGYDSDLKLSKLIRVIPNSKHLWFHRYQHIYAPMAYTTYSLFWIFIKDFVILFSVDEYTRHKKFGYQLSFWMQKIFYLLYIIVLPVVFSLQAWVTVLMAFLCMHMVQSLFLLFTFFMTHHVEATHYPTVNKDGTINASWLMNQVKSSNDMYPFSRVANFIFGGFNNHTAHHLFPHIHHAHYPELSKVLYKILNEYGIKPNQTTYWGGMRSHLLLLKKRGLT